MNITFTKMHGLGNDFIVLEDFANELELDAGQIKRLADRRFGIGFDQLLLIQSSEQAAVDIRYRIFNADGGEVEQCGNGIRCIARYLSDKTLLGKKDELLAETVTGLVKATLLDDGQVQVNMGVPMFSAASIPLSITELSHPLRIALATETLQAMVLSMGNPHAVLTVDNTAVAAVESIARAIQQHRLFPASVNVGFMQIIDRTHIKVRVYERGVGETLACGTGACAAVVAGIFNGQLEQEVNVTLQGGDLQVSWSGEGSPVWMTGPATSVYTGQIEI